MWVPSLLQEDPTCGRATEPMQHKYWAWALEPASRGCWSLYALGPILSCKRSPCNEKTTHLNEKSPPLVIIEKTLHIATKTQHSWGKKRCTCKKGCVCVRADTHRSTHTRKHGEEADCGEVLGEDFWSFIIRIMTGKAKHCFEICLCVWKGGWMLLMYSRKYQTPTWSLYQLSLL